MISSTSFVTVTVSPGIGAEGTGCSKGGTTLSESVQPAVKYLANNVCDPSGSGLNTYVVTIFPAEVATEENVT